MVEKVFKDVAEVIDGYAGNARRVLEYSLVMKRMVDAAKQPGFGVDSWGPLEALIATDEFERVGNFKEVMAWRPYAEFLTRWATTSEWECSFRRITEQDGVVWLELEERSGVGEHKSVANTLTVYEFNAAGKLRRLDVYTQMEPVTPEMLAAYG